MCVCQNEVNGVFEASLEELRHCSFFAAGSVFIASTVWKTASWQPAGTLGVCRQFAKSKYLLHHVGRKFVDMNHVFPCVIQACGARLSFTLGGHALHTTCAFMLKSLLVGMACVFLHRWRAALVPVAQLLFQVVFGGRTMQGW